MSSVDTIAAIATPLGRGGVGIVRVSGPDTQRIAHAIVDSPPAVHRASYRAFKSAEGEVIDSGIVLLFRAPQSFTGEDVLELHGHGGRVVLAMVLARVLELGARAARAGEFSLRAFMNDKIDLAQAEALADLIDSQTEAQAKSAQRSLQGVFSERVGKLVTTLVELRKWIEAAIDFSDEDVEILSSPQIRQHIDTLTTELGETLLQATAGVLLKEGVTLVIAGRPNVGKSSLLNRLTGEETAIVTETPGTTRDLLREHISLDGLPVRVIDTAGLRKTDDEVERQGIERAWKEVSRADVVMLVIDDQVGFTLDDAGIHATLADNHRKIVVRNKIDLSGTEVSVVSSELGTEVSCSALTGAGLEVLRDQLKAAVGFGQAPDPVYLARQRHVDALKRAAEQVDKATRGMDQAAGLELVAEDLRLAQNSLAEITGEFTDEDLLDLIFADFCIGK